MKTLTCDRCKATTLSEGSADQGWLFTTLHWKVTTEEGSERKGAEMDLCVNCRLSLQAWLDDPTACPFDRPLDTSVSDADRSAEVTQEPAESAAEAPEAEPAATPLS